ncbi:hypothetical protein QD460_31630 [Rhizobium jaguaris]|uniref:hypothetical protein n=1 Tax=Rhizobium jaguaris TaxID=1312183 RepID=UPI0039BF568F
MSEAPTDTRIRSAAVEHIKRASAGGVITADELRAGFFVDGQRIPLINPQRGIFKPASMKYLLSVRTVYPRTGARVWSDDQRTVHAQRWPSIFSICEDIASMANSRQYRRIDMTETSEAFDPSHVLSANGGEVHFAGTANASHLVAKTHLSSPFEIHAYLIT